MSALRRLIPLFGAALFIAGCGGSAPEINAAPKPSATAPQQTAGAAVTAGFKEITPGSIYKGEIKINEPEASGDDVYEENGALIDASHTDDGYVMVKAEGIEGKVKALVQSGDKKYQYDIKPDGEYVVLPLQMGDGAYNVGLYQNVKESSYAPLVTADIDVSLSDETRPFVFPNQYVWYTNDERATKLSYDITDGLTTDAEKAQALYDYVVNYLTYDDDRAAQVQSGQLTSYLPDLEQVLDAKKGICFDYTALYAAMLRAQNIPARLAIGNVQPDNIYHAWNYVNIDGDWQWKDPTFGPDSDIPEDNYTYEREY